MHIDGEDIRNVNLDSWRARCGVVMQDGFIFSGSVADNIALSDENPTLERLKHAARLARIAERIEALPMGYHPQTRRPLRSMRTTSGKSSTTWSSSAGIRPS